MTRRQLAVVVKLLFRDRTVSRPMAYWSNASCYGFKSTYKVALLVLSLLQRIGRLSLIVCFVKEFASLSKITDKCFELARLVKSELSLR